MSLLRNTFASALLLAVAAAPDVARAEAGSQLGIPDSDISVEPVLPNPEQQVKIKFQLVNLGNAATGAFKVKLEVKRDSSGETETQSLSVEGLPACSKPEDPEQCYAEGQGFEFEHVFPETGGYDVKILVDPEGATKMAAEIEGYRHVVVSGAPQEDEDSSPSPEDEESQSEPGSEAEAESE